MRPLTYYTYNEKFDYDDKARRRDGGQDMKQVSVWRVPVDDDDGNLLINRPKKCTRYIIFIYFHDTYLYSITAAVAGPVQPGDRVWWSSSSAGISSSISRTFIHLCLWWLCCYAMPTSVGGHSNEKLLLLTERLFEVGTYVLQLHYYKTYWIEFWRRDCR